MAALPDVIGQTIGSMIAGQIARGRAPSEIEMSAEPQGGEGDGTRTMTRQNGDEVELETYGVNYGALQAQARVALPDGVAWVDPEGNDVYY